MVRLIALVLAAWSVAEIPADYSVPAVVAAVRYGVEAETLLGYLAAEHGGDWSDDPEACSDRGACGPYSLTPLWPRTFGYSQDAVMDRWESAEIAARLVLYSRDRHRGCQDGHGWRAHLLCGPGSRGRCARPVARWEALEAAIVSAAEALLAPLDSGDSEPPTDQAGDPVVVRALDRLRVPASVQDRAQDDRWSRVSPDHDCAAVVSDPCNGTE